MPENKEHLPECECCKNGVGALVEKEMRAMEEHGWYCHMVYDKTTANLHTHGISETWDHPDFQVVLLIDSKVVHSIFAIFVDKIKEGERFSDGDIVEKIIGNGLSVKLLKAAENDRDVLRIILPDDEGHLEFLDFNNALYADQYNENR